MTKQAASFNKMNRSIGWDVAVTNKGPELIGGQSRLVQMAVAITSKAGAEANS